MLLTPLIDANISHVNSCDIIILGCLEFLVFCDRIILEN